MKTTVVNFPKELREQIDLLNSLYELSLKQKTFIENCDYENLFTTKSNFNKIAHIIKERREKLASLGNDWDGDPSGIPQNIQQMISELMNQINSLMRKVLLVENQNCDLLQKINEGFTNLS